MLLAQIRYIQKSSLRSPMIILGERLERNQVFRLCFVFLIEESYDRLYLSETAWIAFARAYVAVAATIAFPWTVSRNEDILLEIFSEPLTLKN